MKQIIDLLDSKMILVTVGGLFMTGIDKTMVLLLLQGVEEIILQP